MCASTPVSALHPLGLRVLPAWYAFLVVDSFVAGWGLRDGPGLASCRAHALCPHFFPWRFFPGWWPFSSTAGRPSMQVGVSSPVGSLRQAKSGTSLLVRDQLPRAVPPAPRSSRLDMRFIVGVSSPWCGTSPLDDPPHSLTQLTPHASRTARSLRQCMALPNASAGLVEQLATPQSTQHHTAQLNTVSN